MQAQDILSFWFTELEPSDHFKKSAKLDAIITRRFASIHAAACGGELYAWRKNKEGRLAEIIILDQFSRNMFRDSPRAFAQDAMALTLAQEMVAQDLAKALPPNQRAFAYMPYMHSESALIQQTAIKLFAEQGLENQYKYAQRHKEIIDHFGHYPHRNKALGRAFTEEELKFLEEPNSSF